MTEKPFLKTPGEILSAARQAVPLTLDELSTRTKIPIKVLTAIEQDEYHKISGALYVHSFLRTYAEDVDLDPQVILEHYQNFSGEVSGAGGTAAAESIWEEEEVKIRRVGLPWGRLALVMAIAGVVLIAGGVTLIRGCSGPAEETAGRQEEPIERESLLPPDTSRTVAAEEFPTETATLSVVDPVAEAAAGAGDSLAAGWWAEPERDDPSPGATRQNEDVIAAPTVSNVAETVAEQELRTGDDPRPALPAGADLIFEGGRKWPVVLRLICLSTLGGRVRRDAEPVPQPVMSAGGSNAPLLPEHELVAGRAYRVREGLAVYWGAEDHFTLQLDRLTDVRATVNGRDRNLSGFEPGDEFVLDTYSRGN